MSGRQTWVLRDRRTGWWISVGDVVADGSLAAAGWRTRADAERAIDRLHHSRLPEVREAAAWLYAWPVDAT